METPGAEDAGAVDVGERGRSLYRFRLYTQQDMRVRKDVTL